MKKNNNNLKLFFHADFFSLSISFYLIIALWGIIQSASLINILIAIELVTCMLGILLFFLVFDDVTGLLFALIILQ